ncbi:MAG: alpha/beta fold hydrolase [Rubrobacter sp.]|nr:alpha/beta fold hydrolase [Rubrobacter sp.]
MATPARSAIRSTGQASIVVALGLALAAAVLMLLLSSTASSAQDGASKTPAVLGTNGASVPKIQWESCPKDVATARWQCAEVRVPLSYRHPDGRKITLALGRLPAADQERKIGTLFENPGGPGASGRIPAHFSKTLHKRFDIVGFDTRGTNASTPLTCFTSDQQSKETFQRPFPADPKQVKPFFKAQERGTRLCERNAGPIISHMSTANVARDMDLLRQAVGDKKMTYHGVSYGTFLGSTYANLFPGKVRAITIDGVVDPKEWTTGEKGAEGSKQPLTYRMGSFNGAQHGLETFLAACASAGPGRCAFAERGAGPGELLARYEQILERLHQGPVKVTDGGQTSSVTYQDAVGTTLGYLYHPKYAPTLASFLEDLHEATQAAGQKTAPSAPPEVDVPDVSTTPTFARPQPPVAAREWFLGVACLDSTNPPSVASWPRYARKADEQAPGFGSWWVYISTPCPTWPAEDQDRYQGPWNKETANPVLVVGNRLGDPSTPYENARTTANRRLADARLLTLDSYGHIASYNHLSHCINKAVDRYLVQTKLPPKGKVCQPNHGPFDTQPTGGSTP